MPKNTDFPCAKGLTAMTNLPAIIVDCPARPVPDAELPDFGDCTEREIELMRAAYAAGIRRGFRQGKATGVQLGRCQSGSEDASYKEGYDQAVADMRRLGG